ncbi:MAG: mono/diheme cytochrome c family protein [Lentimonas sp.]|jgi:mono/diheme cytochrome c family protein
MAPTLELSSFDVQEGQRVVRLHCATCHGVDDQTRESMLSPSLWAVRQHYIRKYPEPEAFVTAMMAFLDHPKTESSLMPQASEEYGLMAMLPLDEAQMRAAVRLIYAGHVPRPPWARAYDEAHAPCYGARAD